jgi:hypothetical protein
MHMPTTTIDAGSTQTIGVYCNQPLLRWTEENGARTFEEQVVTFTTISGDAWRTTQIVELSA